MMLAQSLVQDMTRAKLRAIVGLTSTPPPAFYVAGNGRRIKVGPEFDRQLRMAAWGELELRKRQPGIRGGK